MAYNSYSHYSFDILQGAFMKFHNTLLAFCLSGIVSLHVGCSMKADEQQAAQTAIKVRVEQAKAFDFTQAISYSGSIEAAESIPLSFAAMGTVAAVFVAEGDEVRKGRLLAALNDESAKNAYEMALAALKQAEDAFQRLSPMYKNGNLPEIKMIECETNLNKARSAAAISKKNLDDCRLYAPAAGLIGRRSIEPGMIATPNLASITIIKIQRVYARVAVSENEIASVHKGQAARIHIAALPRPDYTGRVEEIGVVADPLAHSYKIKIGLNNPDNAIKPGMICQVFVDNKSSHGSVIPVRAVLTSDHGDRFVYVVNSENRAVRRVVTLGELLQEAVEIKSGLEKDDRVITSGQQKLIDNAAVEIVGPRSGGVDHVE
jgi:membrane fusion protein, multidrug efflux system